MGLVGSKNYNDVPTGMSKSLTICTFVQMQYDAVGLPVLDDRKYRALHVLHADAR